MGFIPIDTLSRTVTSQLLPFQASHRLLLQIIEIELIYQPPNMDAQLRVVVIGDDPIRYRDDLHLKEGELVDQSQHLMIAPLQPRHRTPCSP